jgi:LytTr DNA-binding domain-containing protein
MRGFLFHRRWDMRPGRPGFYAAALPILFAAYVLVLALTSRVGLAQLLGNACANVLSLIVLAVAVRAVLRKFAFGRPPIIQLATLIAAGAVFTILWFWLLMVLLGAVSGHNAITFSVAPFLGPAAAWQLLQGLTFYALAAILFHAETLADRMRAMETAAASERPAAQPPRLFVKREDEIRPLDAARIVYARGADDYSEVVTGAGSHLVRMSLATLGSRLGEGFIRAHRSYLVNVERIARAEPAGGGRILLHMENGAMIATSRAGARLLRERFI